MILVQYALGTAAAAVAAPVVVEAARTAVDVSIDVIKRGGAFVCKVFNDNNSDLLVVAPPVSDPHVAIELAREMYRIGSLILTPELDATWGHA